MQYYQAPVLPSAPQPAQAPVIPQNAMQPAPNVLQPMPAGSGLQNVFVVPRKYAPFAEGYAYKQALFLGCAHLFIGVVSIILQCVAIGTQIPVYYVGQGIWGGLFFILIGAFGVASGIKKRKCMVITFMVLSILSAVIFVGPVMTPPAVGLIFTEEGDWLYSATGRYQLGRSEAARMRLISYSVNGILVFLTLAEFIIAIWSAVVCCGGVCCRKKIPFTGNVQYTAGAYPQVIMINQQAAQIPMVPQGMPGQQQYTHPPVYGAGGPPPYEQNNPLPPKA